MRRLATTVLALGLATTAAPAVAQMPTEFGIAVAPSFRSFSLDESLAASSTSLLLLPVSVEVPIGRRFAVDAYTAFARGSADVGTGSLTLSGMVDTQLRGVWAVTPWARVTVGLNLPTGNSTHSLEEAQVAAILSTDLLGFREANFGVGAGVTTGLAAAHQVGEWGLGYGVSYRLTGEFEPDTATVYSPGDELVARVAIDRNVGQSAKLTFGGMVQHFSEDEFESNLFQPGTRVRGDAAYAFRAGRTTTIRLFVTDLWRQQGEASLASAPDDPIPVGAQNVVILGGVANMGGRLGLSPRADLRVLSHEEGRGSGWMAGAGLALAIRTGGIVVAPRARLMMGAIEALDGESHGVTGFEVELGASF